jgi:hypothetical protein
MVYFLCEDPFFLRKMKLKIYQDHLLRFNMERFCVAVFVQVNNSMEQNPLLRSSQSEIPCLLCSQGLVIDPCSEQINPI